VKQIANVSSPNIRSRSSWSKTAVRIFVNVPDAKQVAVVDREKRAVIATWPMEKFQANFSDGFG